MGPICGPKCHYAVVEKFGLLVEEVRDSFPEELTFELLL
jgi:hypothetical protein